LRQNKPPALASLLNLVTAMKTIQLPSKTPLDYFKEILWDDSLAQDRFFGFADKFLVDQVRRAAMESEFAQEPSPRLFHPDATSSFKQIQFGEANVQLTFHEKDTKTIAGVPCIKVEPDIDYFKDLGAHTLLEVIPNSITHGLTDPKKVYVLHFPNRTKRHEMTNASSVQITPPVNCCRFRHGSNWVYSPDREVQRHHSNESSRTDQRERRAPRDNSCLSQYSS
jgi:hypothetical protein